MKAIARGLEGERETRGSDSEDRMFSYARWRVPVDPSLVLLRW